MKSFIIKYTPKRILSIYANLKLRLSFYYYQIRLPNLTKDIFSKEKIKVVFFPINIGMWKNDYLFDLLLKHPRFEPYIVSFFVPSDPSDYQKSNQMEMKSYFESKGYPYMDMYNFETQKWFNINKFKPDIIFYTQAVDTAYPQYKIKSLWNNSIFYYIPYCLIIANEKAGFNTLLFNISKKVFAPSEFVKKYWSTFFLNKAKNVVVTGYPSFDYLTHPQGTKAKNESPKSDLLTVIWAPHHSIFSDDIFCHSIFLEIADRMLELVKKYENKIHFVFKPHPRLRPKLQQHKDWGVDRTTSYFNFWRDASNATLQEGEYFNLFLSSDAMIHDCITFMAEYLVTSKPALFVKNKNVKMDLNEYGQGCFENHYKAYSFEDIEKFIDDVLIHHNDNMKKRREYFVNKHLLPPDGSLVAETIFEEIVADLL